MSAKERTLIARHAGKVFTRRTRRPYTHVVLIQLNAMYGGDGSWGAVRWCSRLDLARKYAYNRAQYGFVHIAPVEEAP